MQLCTSMSCQMEMKSSALHVFTKLWLSIVIDSYTIDRRRSFEIWFHYFHSMWLLLSLSWKTRCSGPQGLICTKLRHKHVLKDKWTPFAQHVVTRMSWKMKGRHLHNTSSQECLERRRDVICTTCRHKDVLKDEWTPFAQNVVPILPRLCQQTENQSILTFEWFVFLKSLPSWVLANRSQ